MGAPLRFGCSLESLEYPALLSRVEKVSYRVPTTLYVQCSSNAVPKIRVFSSALLAGHRTCETSAEIEDRMSRHVTGGSPV